MEDLDTDVPPPAAAVEATRAAVGEDDANSWPPFNGREDLKVAVVELVKRRGGPGSDPRRGETLRQLGGLPVVAPQGAWAALLDSEALGLRPGELSARLLEHEVAATPMDGWGGEIAGRHLRFVFSNEPVERLALLGERVHAALG